MKNAILLHGMPNKEEYYAPHGENQADCHWFPWLAHQLQIRDIFTARPDIPLSFAPSYPIWKKEFERYDVTPETILVGHSCGGGFLVRWLSENKDVAVGKVVLVAPWLDPLKMRQSTRDFFEFEIDTELAKRTKGVTIFVSNDDEEDILETVTILTNAIKEVKTKEFKKYGHFVLEDMRTCEFPELLEEALH